MKLYLTILLVLISGICPGDYFASKKYKYISIGQDGRPVSGGMQLTPKMIVSDQQLCNIPPDLVTFLAWELRKTYLKNHYRLWTLDQHGFFHVRPYQSEMYADKLLRTKPLLFKSLAPVVALCGENRICVQMGRDGMKLADLFPGRTPPDTAKYTRIKAFENFSKSCRYRNTLNPVMICSNSPEAAVAEVLKGGILNRRNYWGFLQLMRYAGFPEIGMKTMMSIWKPYLGNLSSPGDTAGELLIIATKSPELAEAIVPVLKKNMTSVKDSWVEKYGPYWCKVANLGPEAFGHRRMYGRFRQYCIKWAQLTGKGDEAFNYMRKMFEDELERKKELEAEERRAHPDRIIIAKNKVTQPGVLEHSLPLLGLNCRLSYDIRLRILEKCLSQGNKFFIGYCDGKKLSFAPHSYSALNEMLKRVSDADKFLIYDAIVKPDDYKIYDTAIYRKNKKGKYDYLKRDTPNQWLKMHKAMSLTGFLFSKYRRREFFDYLWQYKGRVSAQNLVTSCGLQLIPLLVEKIADNEPYSALIACNIIARMGTYATEAATGPLLEKLRGSQSYLVKAAIIRTLGEIKAEDALSEIQKQAETSKYKLVKINAEQVMMLFKKITKEDVEKVIENRNRPRRIIISRK